MREVEGNKSDCSLGQLTRKDTPAATVLCCAATRIH